MEILILCLQEIKKQPNIFSINDPIAMMVISHPENKYFLIRLRYNIIITPNEKVDCLLYVKNRNMSFLLLP